MVQNENRLTAEMKQALPVIRQTFGRFAPSGFQVEFSALKEWHHHTMWSLHHSGSAVDIRTKTLPDRGLGVISTLIANYLKEALNRRFGIGKYTVLLNDQGPHFPHIHVQYNKGTRMSTPGDFDGSRRNPVA